MANRRTLPLTEPPASLRWVPSDAHHAELVRAVERCQGCDLYARATRAVFGEGPVDARIMLVGEQPGDHEDVEGRPFVGPAGRLLDEALDEAGLPRDEVYVTNAVKHFKWEARGKRRLHARPNAVEVQACRGWLDAEVELVDPEIIVCLGATAAQIFLGRRFRITKQRGVLLSSQACRARILATFHPSALLRMRAGEDAEFVRAKRFFVQDLRAAAEAARPAPRPSRRGTRRPSQVA